MSETKPFFSRRGVVLKIDKFATHDGPGIRTVVFLKGCPLRCVWCHSPESWAYGVGKYPDGETIGTEMPVEAALAEVLKDKDFYDVSHGGVTLSGGEPLAQPEFCFDFFSKAKAAGLHTAIETSGFAAAKTVESLFPCVDLWLYDIKALKAAKYQEYTSRPLAPSMDNLRRIDKGHAEGKTGGIVLRCSMIPGLNDSYDDLRQIGALADELRSVRQVDVEPYVPYGIDKAKRLGLKVFELPQPPVEYGDRIVTALQRLTRKPVKLG